MPFYKVMATSIETFKAIIEAKNEQEAYQIGKEDENVIFEPVDYPNGDWEVDSYVQEFTENGEPIQ